MKRKPGLPIFGDLMKMGLLGMVVILPLAWIAGQEFHWAIAPFAFALGVLVGWIELVLFRKLFTDISLPVSLIGKVVFYYVGTILLSLVFSIPIEVYIERNKTISQVLSEISDLDNLLNMIKIIPVIMVMVLYLQIETLVGKGMFSKYLGGAYYQPAVQERVFMFVDMMDSTALAERFGDRVYYRFLNKFIRNMSRAIYESGGEIYKYMGDEVIVSWRVRKRTKVDKMIATVFNIYQQIEEEKPRYMQEFGSFPKFRASMHMGDVICAQIGDLKKEIAYNGDVVNTASRMQKVVKEYRERFIISEALFQKMDNKDRYEIRDLGKVRIPGKSQEIGMRILKIR